MVQGDWLDGDYFIDCNNISLASGRALFGGWVHILVTISVYSIRSLFLSNLTTHLVPQDQTRRVTNLWTISPATSLSEVFALRRILFRDFSRAKLPFILTSLACILALILTALSTAIANATVVSNVVTRQRIVQGKLAFNDWVDIVPDSMVNLTSRAHALDNANAPLEELFDFVPDDESGWLYVAQEWNNSWQGQCIYNWYPSTDLVISSVNLSDPSFQTVVPSLGAWLPQWASANETGQGAEYISKTIYTTDSTTVTDIFAQFAFTNPPDDPNANQSDWTSVNISLANFVAHNISFNSSNFIVQTEFQADVHVAECTYTTSFPESTDKSRANGIADDIAFSLLSIVGVQFQQLSSFTAPTAQDMVRYWQAYMSVKDNLTPHPIQRRLSVSRPVVQMRLSVLFVTLCTLLFVLAAVIRSRLKAPLDPYGRKLRLPNSRLDWMVQAARERPDADDHAHTYSTPAFIKRHKDLVYVASLAPEGQLPSRITSPTNKDPLLVSSEYMTL